MSGTEFHITFSHSHAFTTNIYQYQCVKSAAITTLTHPESSACQPSLDDPLCIQQCGLPCSTCQFCQGKSRSMKFASFYHLVMTKIAMENGPFIDGLPIKNGDFPWQTVSHNQRVHFTSFYCFDGSGKLLTSYHEILACKRRSSTKSTRCHPEVPGVPESSLNHVPSLAAGSPETSYMSVSNRLITLLDEFCLW